MRKSTRPAGGSSEPCSCIPHTRYYKGGGDAMAVMGTFFLGPYRVETTPPMMIPGRNPKEALDLPVHP